MITVKMILPVFIILATVTFSMPIESSSDLAILKDLTPNEKIEIIQNPCTELTKNLTPGLPVYSNETTMRALACRLELQAKEAMARFNKDESKTRTKKRIFEVARTELADSVKSGVLNMHKYMPARTNILRFAKLYRDSPRFRTDYRIYNDLKRSLASINSKDRTAEMSCKKEFFKPDYCMHFSFDINRTAVKDTFNFFNDVVDRLKFVKPGSSSFEIIVTETRLEEKKFTTLRKVEYANWKQKYYHGDAIAMLKLIPKLKGEAESYIDEWDFG